jgi:hypothetical protein
MRHSLTYLPSSYARRVMPIPGSEVRAFADANVAWLAQVLFRLVPSTGKRVIGKRALAIYAAVGGTQLAARSRADIRFSMRSSKAIGPPA